MIDESLLDDALNRRAPSPGPEVGDLVRLADLTGSLPFPGPDVAARTRMTARFDDYVTGRSRPGFGAWILGWVGAGPRPRTAVQRLAAGGVILLASASGASAATGQTPAGIATGVASFTENLIHNLAPRQPADPTPPIATATTTPTATPAETQTPTPSATPTPPGTTPSSQVAPVDGPGTAGQNRGGESSPTPRAQAETPSATPTQPGLRQGTYDAGDAGSVRLSYNDSSLTVLSVQANKGWQYSIKQGSGQHVEVTFDNNDRRLSFYATLDSGQPSIQIRTTLPASTTTRLPQPGVTRIPTATPQPSYREDSPPSEGDAPVPGAGPGTPTP